MKTTLALLLALTCSAEAHARKVTCTNDQLFYRKAEVNILSRQEVTFTVLEARGDTDVGKTADLFYTETVHPRGRTFFHYHGNFEAGASTKTYSFYLSEDGKTLTEMIKGEPYDWTCE